MMFMKQMSPKTCVLDPILTLLFDCSDKVVALLTPLYISCYKTDNNKKGGGGWIQILRIFSDELLDRTLQHYLCLKVVNL